MLKIGDFSRLGQVTVKTLRHYGQMGLLKPAWIDRYTGYRYYALEQLPRLNRILALKELGFSLEQIAPLLDDNLSAEQLQGIVMLKRAELEQRVQSEQMRLARVEARLRQIEQEGKLPVYEVILRRVPDQMIACARTIVPTLVQLDEQRGKLRRMVSAWLDTARVKASGPWLALYEHPEYTERDIELRFGRGLESGVRSSEQGQVRVNQLPAVETMACVVHGSSQAELYPALHTFYSWADSNGYRVGGPVRELYLEEESGESAGSPMVEHQFPVELIRMPQQVFSGLHITEQKMEPKIVTKPSFLVAGTLYQGNNKNQEIAVMWQEEFLPRMDEVNSVSHNTYGVCIESPELPDGEFQYIAGMEVTSEENIPEGMVLKKVPEGLYAVFEHHGSIEKLSETYAYIYQSWLPSSGYKRTAAIDYELYDEKFNDVSEDSILYLYVPVEKVE
jgi:predicted transcriptional regulator YdeE/DNA-binding transcriptional MerR regulator